MHMLPQQVAEGGCALEADKRVHLLVLPTLLTSRHVRAVKSVPQAKQGDAIPQQHRVAAWNGGDMRVLRHTGSTKATIVRNSLQCTFQEQQN